MMDIGGSHSQRNTRHVFMHMCHGIILVHDLTNRKSCLNLDKWLAEVMRAEAGSTKYSGAWDGAGPGDIGEVREFNKELSTTFYAPTCLAIMGKGSTSFVSCYLLKNYACSVFCSDQL